MSRWDEDNGYYSRISNDLLREIARLKLSPAQRSVLDCVIRYTYGYGVKKAPIALSRVSEFTGRNTRDSSVAISALVKYGIVINYGMTGKGRVLGVNKHTSEWTAPRCKNSPDEIKKKKKLDELTEPEESEFIAEQDDDEDDDLIDFSKYTDEEILKMLDSGG